MHAHAHPAVQSSSQQPMHMRGGSAHAHAHAPSSRAAQAMTAQAGGRAAVAVSAASSASKQRNSVDDVGVGNSSRQLGLLPRRPSLPHELRDNDPLFGNSPAGSVNSPMPLASLSNSVSNYSSPVQVQLQPQSISRAHSLGSVNSPSHAIGLPLAASPVPLPLAHPVHFQSPYGLQPSYQQQAWPQQQSSAAGQRAPPPAQVVASSASPPSAAARSVSPVASMLPSKRKRVEESSKRRSYNSCHVCKCVQTEPVEHVRCRCGVIFCSRARCSKRLLMSWSQFKQALPLLGCCIHCAPDSKRVHFGDNECPNSNCQAKKRKTQEEGSERVERRYRVGIPDDASPSPPMGAGRQISGKAAVKVESSPPMVQRLLATTAGTVYPAAHALQPNAAALALPMALPLPDALAPHVQLPKTQQLQTQMLLTQRPTAQMHVPPPMASSASSVFSTGATLPASSVSFVLDSHPGSQPDSTLAREGVWRCGDAATLSAAGMASAVASALPTFNPALPMALPLPQSYAYAADRQQQYQRLQSLQTMHMQQQQEYLRQVQQHAQNAQYAQQQQHQIAQQHFALMQPPSPSAPRPVLSTHATSGPALSSGAYVSQPAPSTSATAGGAGASAVVPSMPEEFVNFRNQAMNDYVPRWSPQRVAHFLVHQLKLPAHASQAFLAAGIDGTAFLRLTPTDLSHRLGLGAGALTTEEMGRLRTAILNLRTDFGADIDMSIAAFGPSMYTPTTTTTTQLQPPPPVQHHPQMFVPVSAPSPRAAPSLGAASTLASLASSSAAPVSGSTTRPTYAGGATGGGRSSYVHANAAPYAMPSSSSAASNGFFPVSATTPMYASTAPQPAPAYPHLSQQSLSPEQYTLMGSMPLHAPHSLSVAPHPFAHPTPLQPYAVPVASSSTHVGWAGQTSGAASEPGLLSSNTSSALRVGLSAPVDSVSVSPRISLASTSSSAFVSTAANTAGVLPQHPVFSLPPVPSVPLLRAPKPVAPDGRILGGGATQALISPSQSFVARPHAPWVAATGAPSLASSPGLSSSGDSSVPSTHPLSTASSASSAGSHALPVGTSLSGGVLAPVPSPLRVSTEPLKLVPFAYSYHSHVHQQHASLLTAHPTLQLGGAHKIDPASSVSLAPRGALSHLHVGSSSPLSLHSGLTPSSVQSSSAAHAEPPRIDTGSTLTGMGGGERAGSGDRSGSAMLVASLGSAAAPVGVTSSSPASAGGAEAAESLTSMQAATTPARSAESKGEATSASAHVTAAHTTSAEQHAARGAA